ncbi:hypothetical protein HYC85_005878 [Camellia sinensis]|uniref:Uncharacterized protein n=1 Tax=Camellia sinensis TaxID=4442 RepID=A0A7J7I0R1_CAMSI|nr:hypothetical protein HYC85_005878 [Camellia sinensis]
MCAFSQTLCCPRAFVKKKGRNNVTVDDLVHVITPKGRDICQIRLCSSIPLWIDLVVKFEIDFLLWGSEALSSEDSLARARNQIHGKLVGTPADGLKIYLKSSSPLFGPLGWGSRCISLWHKNCMRPTSAITAKRGPTNARMSNSPRLVGSNLSQVQDWWVRIYRHQTGRIAPSLERVRIHELRDLLGHGLERVLSKPRDPRHSGFE